jgi:hypothetical protein
VATFFITYLHRLVPQNHALTVCEPLLHTYARGLQTLHSFTIWLSYMQNRYNRTLLGTSPLTLRTRWLQRLLRQHHACDSCLRQRHRNICLCYMYSPCTSTRSIRLPAPFCICNIGTSLRVKMTATSDVKTRLRHDDCT